MVACIAAGGAWSGHHWRGGTRWGGAAHAVECMTKMDHDRGTQLDIDFWSGGQNPGDLLGAVSETSPVLLILTQVLLSTDHFVVLLLELGHVSNCQLQDVSLFQTGNIFPIILKTRDQDLFELVKAPIDAGTALTFKQRFSNLLNRKKGKCEFSNLSKNNNF